MGFKLEIDTDRFTELIIASNSGVDKLETKKFKELTHNINLKIGSVKLQEGNIGTKTFRYGEMNFIKDIALLGQTTAPQVEIYLSLEGIYQSQVKEHRFPFNLAAHRFSISYSPDPSGKCLLLENIKNSFFEVNFTKKDLLSLNITSSRTYDELLTAILKNTPFAVSYQGIPLDWDILKIVSQIKSPPVRTNLMPHYIAIKLEELMIHLLQQCDRYHGKEIHKLSGRDHKRLVSVVDYLNVNYKNFPTIDKASRISGACASKISSDFKKVYGCTIFEYCQMLRMKDAQYMLQQTDLTIAQVAYDIGYRNPQHFTSAFKRYFGILPRSVRPK